MYFLGSYTYILDTFAIIKYIVVQRCTSRKSVFMIGLPKVYVSMSANGNYSIVFVYTPLASLPPLPPPPPDNYLLIIHTAH